MAVVNAWFDPPGVALAGASPDRPRHAFRMDVAFQAARLGGEGEEVRFRVRLRECEVVVRRPDGETDIGISRQTIDAGGILATVERTDEAERSGRAHAEAAIGLGSTGATAKAGAGVAVSHTSKATVTQSLPLLVATRSQTLDGHLSWRVQRTDGIAGLDGLLWDARNGPPRFTAVDTRTPEERARHERTALPPTLRVEVRAKSEDLIIDRLELTDARPWSKLGPTRKAEVAARAFIKRSLIEERLPVGDIHEPFSDLVIGDMVVALTDRATGDGSDANDFDDLL